MPNWCEGYLKVRGKIADLKTFVLDGLQPVTLMGTESEKIKFYSESDISFCVFNNGRSLWLKGTHRHFCEPDYIEVCADDTESQTIMVIQMKAAWDIDSESLLALCEKYGVDMKIQAFEMGQQFSRVVEIVDGEIIQDERIEYKDWDWDCPCPHMGG